MKNNSPAERYGERRKQECERKKRCHAGIMAEWRWFRHKYPHPYEDELRPFLIQELDKEVLTG